MAKVVTQELLIQVSKIGKNNAPDHQEFLDDETIETLERAIEQLVDDENAVIEVTKVNE